MQNVADLRREITRLRTAMAGRAQSVRVVPSPESWNPVAAVELVDLNLPAGITPSRVTLRIPLPDLYGFACSAAVGITETPLTCAGPAGPVRVPFCVRADAATLAAQRPFYADLRARGDELAGRYTICVTPAQLPARFQHLPLPEFVDALLRYLADPVGAVQAEIERTTRTALTGGTTVVEVLRLAHLLDGIGERDEAARLLERGTELFPDDPWIRRQRRELGEQAATEAASGI
jgi:hypothetical protein